ncbi:unnamed protein product [Chrysoparadoxa australica]
MSSLIRDLVGGGNCAADGTISASNPMSKVVDSVMMGGARAPAQQTGPQQGNDIQRGMARGAAIGQGPAQMSGQPHWAMNPAQMRAEQERLHHMNQMQHMHGEGQGWASEFQRSGSGPSGPGHPHPAAFEGAWDQGQGWAGEFQRMGPGSAGGMPHPAMMEAAWAAHHSGMVQHGMRPQVMPPNMEKAWRAQSMPHMASERMNQAWSSDSHAHGQAKAHNFATPSREALAEASKEATQPGSFSDAWAGLNGGVTEAGLSSAGGLGEAWSEAEASSKQQRGLEAGWAEAKAGGLSVEQRAWEEATQGMESAWEEARAHDASELDHIWDEGETLDEVWKKTSSELEALGGSEGYKFAEDNTYLDNTDPFAEGVRLLEEGDIAGAIMCFEAELQQRPQNAEAWTMLGQAHQENDQDKLAITCLDAAVDHDPYNLEALLALGVSCVNELDSEKALRTLKAWVQHNPTYAGLQIQVDEYSDGSLMDEVMQLMLQAQEFSAADPDAKVVLGVLYNVSRNYDAAAEAFELALRARPADYGLWNKLGATLANSNRSAEAIPMYHKALEMKPRYARGWLNLGISMANLNRYSEAANCYLKALSLNRQAKHIWAYLRIVWTCEERFDLVQLASKEDLSVFAEEFNLEI